MKSTFTFLGLILLASFSAQAQTFNLGIVGLPTFGCTAACNPSVCSPTASGGQPIPETINSSPYLIPANSFVRVQISSVLCAVATAGPGLDLGDSVFINGVSVVNPSFANTIVNYDQCFSTTNPYTLTVSLKANRRDETIRVVLTIGSGAGTGCSILPPPVRIRLAEFNAKRNNNETVTLFWKTASEQNNRYMAVERSSDGFHFSEVGRLNGAGNSAVPLSYQLTDFHPTPGNNYYRLRSVDFDGTATYSRMVLIAGTSTVSSLQLYPNPAANQLNITSRETIREWSILDLKGRLVLQGTAANSNTVWVNTAALPSGMYFVKVITNTNTVTEKFIRQ